mmetsp:Transcript_29590/g.87542  ORF Transcript_29590/g.87542 Transcript_29590/m.87542 type:complete len:159 (-) Transcript_29590:896-1372(-)|eukprot:365535-Chlamydomonas_euryale.AAC.47
MPGGSTAWPVGGRVFVPPPLQTIYSDKVFKTDGVCPPSLDSEPEPANDGVLEDERLQPASSPQKASRFKVVALAVKAMQKWKRAVINVYADEKSVSRKRASQLRTTSGPPRQAHLPDNSEALPHKVRTQSGRPAVQSKPHKVDSIFHHVGLPQPVSTT